MKLLRILLPALLLTTAFGAAPALADGDSRHEREDRREQRQYRDAWEVVDYIGQVTIGELIHVPRDDD